jgi:hypothetical protein
MRKSFFESSTSLARALRLLTLVVAGVSSSLIVRYAMALPGATSPGFSAAGPRVEAENVSAPNSPGLAACYGTVTGTAGPTAPVIVWNAACGGWNYTWNWSVQFDCSSGCPSGCSFSSHT